MTPPDVILIFFAVFITTACLGFGWILYQTSKDREIERYNRLHRFIPDQLGNKPDWFDPATLRSYRPRPGNTIYAPQQNFIVGNSPVTVVPRVEPMRPLFHTGMPFKVVQNERSVDWPNVENEPGNIERSENVLSDRDIIGELTAAKRGGQPKEKSITRVTRVTKGGSPAWKEWSRIWEELPTG